MLRTLSFQVSSNPMGPGGFKKASTKVRKVKTKKRKRKVKNDLENQNR